MKGVDLVDCWVVVFCVNCVYILIILFGSFFFGVFFIILKYLNIKVKFLLLNNLYCVVVFIVKGICLV